MPITRNLADSILSDIKSILNHDSGVSDIQARICSLLNEKVDYYNWVGFYLVDPQKPDELILGSYIGATTDHTRIKFGEGICGQAADTGKIFLVDDVSRESNYLSCSINVKSEIVLPIFKNNKLIGELDIDSFKIAAFDKSDKDLLSEICSLFSEYI